MTSLPCYLKRHKQYKHEEKQFYCDVCDYVGASNATLKKHKLSKHAKVRHSCEDCEFATTDPSSLRKHVKRKHSGISYPCDQCDHVSSSKFFLLKHTEVKHAVSIPIYPPISSTDEGIIQLIHTHFFVTYNWRVYVLICTSWIYLFQLRYYGWSWSLLMFWRFNSSFSQKISKKMFCENNLILFTSDFFLKRLSTYF